MKKKNILIIGIIILLIVIAVILSMVLNKKELDYPDDENTLYSVKFDNIKLRFERYDYALGQNQIVGVQKSTNYGKDYEDITKEGITVSMEPKFIFFNEKFGFAVKKPNNQEENGKYYGMYVTKDGGKTFKLSEITYENPGVEILTIEDVPYYEKNKLKLHCSIYQVKSDGSGYEDVDLYFVTDDEGLTWHLEEEKKEVSLKIKSETLSTKGATFILKNTTDDEYSYGDPYTIEEFKNGNWKEIDTLTGEPQSWNDILYNLKSKEEKEININWSFGYGELKRGTYRIVKNDLRKSKSYESRTYTVYAEFEIKY